jgi:hypothetical protein
MMLRSSLSQEFVSLICQYYPRAGRTLKLCYVKVLECYIHRLEKNLYYIGIYYPEGLLPLLDRERDVLRDVAENMGLSEVVYLNATRLIHDPKSRLKHENPRLWLELYWVNITIKN